MGYYNPRGMRTSGIRKVHALLIRSTPWGERDRLIVLFGEQAGRIQAKAVSALEAGSRMAPLLVPPALGEFSLVSGRSGIPVLAGVEIDESFSEWKQGIRKLEAMGVVLSVLDGMEAPEGQNRRMFTLALETLRAEPGEEPLAPVGAFLAGSLEVLGLSGGEGSCSICGEELGGKVAVAAGDLSAFYCAKCFNRQYGQRQVDAPSVPTARLRLLDQLRRMSPAEAHAMRISDADLAFVLNLAMHRFSDLLPQASAVLRRTVSKRTGTGQLTR